MRSLLGDLHAERAVGGRERKPERWPPYAATVPPGGRVGYQAASAAALSTAVSYTASVSCAIRSQE